MRTSFPMVALIGVLVLLLPLGLIPAQGVRGMQDPAGTPSVAGVPGLDPAATAHLGGTLPGDPQIQLVKVAEGFSIPTNVAFPGDDSGRIFVVELDGRIKIIMPDGSVVPQPFLDLSQIVSGRPGQQGLLGLAFHPNFAENGKFYVDYNDLYDNGAITVSEFTIDPKNPDRADPKTERPLLVIPKHSPLHNGGTLRFGADGYLYISVGDGGWQGDAWDNAQNRFTLLGKILRIDVDQSGPGQPYGIPADNPFTGFWRSDNPYPGQPMAQATPEGKSGKRKQRRDRNWPGRVAPEYRNSLPPVRPEIWALGFRNPWQFAFDVANGDLYIGDVGADTWEEINYQPAGTQAGQNYGWDWLEGTHCYPAELQSCPRQQVGLLPIAEYEHGKDGCAVIAIGVSRAPEDPTLDGIFFSGDFCTGEIRGLVRDDAGAWQFANVLDTAVQITGAGQDAHGNLFVASTTGEANDATPGQVWQLVSPDRVPEGAVTVPLGQPRQAPVDISGDTTDGAPAASTEEGAATGAPDTATPVAATSQVADPSQPSETIGMYDIYFEPRRVVIPANTDVRLILENKGEAPHSFELKDQGVLVNVEPHTAAEVVVNLPPGSYKFICEVPGHKQVGMNGSLVVK